MLFDDRGLGNDVRRSFASVDSDVLRQGLLCYTAILRSPPTSPQNHDLGLAWHEHERQTPHPHIMGLSVSKLTMHFGVGISVTVRSFGPAVPADASRSPSSHYIIPHERINGPFGFITIMV